jgi:hypothetical protein
MNSSDHPNKEQNAEIGVCACVQSAPNLVAQYTLADFQHKYLQEQNYIGKLNKCKKYHQLSYIKIDGLFLNFEHAYLDLFLILYFLFGLSSSKNVET